MEKEIYITNERKREKKRKRERKKFTLFIFNFYQEVIFLIAF